jgi:hypothetical protein
MTRKQQIHQALRLIAPPTQQRAECEQDIKFALSRVDREVKAARAFQVATSKKGKAQVRRYYAALRRTRSAYNALDEAIRPWFSLTETAYVAGKPTLIDRQIEIAESFLDRPSPRPRKEAKRNKVAVDAACDLLAWHKVAATRDGNAERLSKILAGDLTVDLFDHLRESKRRLGPTVEKVRGPDFIVYRTRRR